MALWIAVFLATAFLLAPALYINLGSKVPPLKDKLQLLLHSLAIAGAGCMTPSASCMVAAGPLIRFFVHDRTCQSMGRWTGRTMPWGTR